MTFNSLRIINTVSFMGVVAVNFLAVSLPLNGLTPGEISAKFQSEFAPAGYTFSIWSIIYGLILGITIWQFVGKNQLKEDAIAKIGFRFSANAFLNAAWLFAWHFLQLGLSVVLMVGILYSLIQLNNVISFQILPELNARKWLKAAFGIYLGWICIALIANVAATLVGWQWQHLGFSITFWTGSMIGIGACILIAIALFYQNPFIALAGIWALTGIMVRQINVNDVFTPIAWASATWIMPLFVSIFYSNRRKKVKT
ncbi:MAG: hypothetical protein HC817_06925 [Saprospiraceae bacterium]|nr:hypothetical protein [Saprospiraceae bacterium]